MWLSCGDWKPASKSLTQETYQMLTTLSINIIFNRQPQQHMQSSNQSGRDLSKHEKDDISRFLATVLRHAKYRIQPDKRKQYFDF